jgi:hypothetical protein
MHFGTTQLIIVGKGGAQLLVKLTWDKALKPSEFAGMTQTNFLPANINPDAPLGVYSWSLSQKDLSNVSAVWCACTLEHVNVRKCELEGV